MGLFDDINKFLESQLDEFLHKNPHLELQAILEQLQEQEQENKKLILQLQSEEKRLQKEILILAKDLQTWHVRIGKAEDARRMDLANAAREREAALLRQGNQLWGQMKGTQESLLQALELLSEIQTKKQEVKVKADRAKAEQKTNPRTSNSHTTGWNRGASYKNYYGGVGDPLETQFQRLETEDELEEMKRNLGR